MSVKPCIEHAKDIYIYKTVTANTNVYFLNCSCLVTHKNHEVNMLNHTSLEPSFVWVVFFSQAKHFKKNSLRHFFKTKCTLKTLLIKQTITLSTSGRVLEAGDQYIVIASLSD